MSIPTLKYLRAKYPQAQLTMVCRQGLSALILATGLVDVAVEAHKNSSKKWAETVATLKSTNWDWIICPHESIRSHLLVWQLSAKRKTGYRNRWNFLVFDERIHRPMILPEALRQMALVTTGDQEYVLKIAEFQKQVESSDRHHDLLVVPEWASMQIELARNSGVVVEKEKKTVALAPGSVWPTKMWTLEGFAKVARYFLEKDFRVSLIGSKDEQPLAEELMRMVPGLESHVGEFSLVQSLEFLSQCTLALANDSGAQHMAAAVGTPCVSLFGPTTLELGYRPWQNHARVAQLDLDCRPCGRHGAKSCPLRTHACMKNLASDLVIKNMLELC